MTSQASRLRRQSRVVAIAVATIIAVPVFGFLPSVQASAMAHELAHQAPQVTTSSSISDTGTPSLRTPLLTWSQCQSEAKRRKTRCDSGFKIPGSRCSMSWSGVLSLSRSGTLVGCKKSYGTVYVWMWA